VSRRPSGSGDRPDVAKETQSSADAGLSNCGPEAKPESAKDIREFSPRHHREYIEWITEAKRDETRRERLAKTIKWLSEGKPRNWKLHAGQAIGSC
jgi:Bacteriocin-protection, YdeI or OmpD-Associated